MITPIAFNQRKDKALLVQVKLIETARIGRGSLQIFQC